MINKRITYLVILVALPLLLMAQAKKPTLMVMPADVWCISNGFVQKTSAGEAVSSTPDYASALRGSMDCNNVIAKINILMADRNFPLKDLSATLKSLFIDDVTNALTTNSSGARQAESPIDLIKRNANADIVLEVNWSVNTMGPKRSVTYSLTAKDSYTNKQVAGAQGTGTPSFSAELPVLLEEAVIANMDNFCAQLQSHFDDILKHGREVVMEVHVMDDGSGIYTDNEYDGQELSDIIDKWVADNTVEHRYNLSAESITYMKFEQVRIPLYQADGRAMDTRRWVRNLSRYLNTNYHIPSRVDMCGLGKAVLLLGEK